MKLNEVELLAKLMSDDDCKELAMKHGFDDKQITKMFK